ncbi:hypothetical protein [Parapedobacter sp. 2B3]|uniref:hypothetical protein n=1 Tax=Parapedobacter sp. 2B3 TaxID=3342381 RepID=UPI0035B64C09
MKETIKTVDLPKERETTLYDRIKETLAVASQLIIASPVRLPPKVVLTAKYLALALGVLEAVEGSLRDGEGAADEDD